MKRLLVLVLCFTLCLSLVACGDGQTQPDETQKPVEAKLFQQFLNGDIPAYDESGVEKLLDGYLIFDANQYPYFYAFYDVANDGITELCISQYPEQYFFQVKDGQVHHWYTETKSYSHLLDNGAFLYERHGAAPTNIRYEYYELDKNAQVTFSVEFSWWDGATVEQGKVYPDSYFFDGKEVTKAEFDAKTEKYLSIGKDKIVWYDMDGTPHETETQPTLPETKPTEAETQPPANTQPKSLAENIEEEIEAARKADSQLHQYTSTAGQCDLWAKYTQKWKEVADEYYEKIMQYDDVVQPSEYYYSAEDLHTFVSNMKTNWESYSKQQCEHYLGVLQTEYQGGTIVGPLAASYKYKLQKDWALEILKICQMFHIE